MERLRLMIPILAVAAILVGTPRTSSAADFIVYSVFHELDLGNPGETPQKDYYVNMGTAQGLHEGSVLEVLRRVATYDLLSEKLYRDVTFPIAKIKVIHVEGSAAVARLEKLVPSDKSPATNPRAVMVGDIVKLAQ